MARCLPWRNSSKAGDLLVAAGLMPSFEEFCEEIDKELEQILKRRNTCSPFIKNVMTSKRRKLNDSTAENLHPASLETEKIATTNEEATHFEEPEPKYEQNCAMEVLPSYLVHDLAAHSIPSTKKFQQAEHIIQKWPQCSPQKFQNDLHSAKILPPLVDPEPLERQNEDVAQSDQESQHEQNFAQLLPPSPLHPETVTLSEKVSNKCKRMIETLSLQKGIFVSMEKTKLEQLIRQFRSNESYSSDPIVISTMSYYISCYCVALFYLFLVLCGIFRFYLTLIANI